MSCTVGPGRRYYSVCCSTERTEGKRPGTPEVAGWARVGPLVETDRRTAYLEPLQPIGSSMATHQKFAAAVEPIRADASRPLPAGT